MKLRFPLYHCLFTINLCLFFSSFFISVNAKAQVYGDTDSLFRKYAVAAENKSRTYRANFIIADPDLKSLQKKGIQLQRLLSDKLGIFYASDSSMINFIESRNFKYALANDNWKLSASLEKAEIKTAKNSNQKQVYTIIVQDINSFTNFVRERNFQVEIKQVYPATNSILIESKPDILFKEILPLSLVVFVDLYIAPKPDLLLNGYYKTINAISAAEYFYPDANGRGITIGIKENQMDGLDIDLKKRVLFSGLASGKTDIHATTIATLAGGAGNSFISGKGMASHCSFYSSDFNNLFPDSTSLLIQNNISVQNHSYGTQIQAFYGAEAMSYDLQTQQNKNLVHVFSSGNRGLDTSITGVYAGLGGFANLTGNFKMAKNIISIAAIDTGGKIAAYSSSGPLFDGRIAPQLAALGTNGTSEAAAIVSGTIASLQQVYKDLHAQQPATASLIKSVLFSTADDIDSPGIDFQSGYGAINVLRAIECMEKNQFDSAALGQGESWVKTITIPSTATNLRISLSWTDTAAMVNNFKALSNDLDLELRNISTGTIYRPWCLNSYPNPDSLRQIAMRRRDSLNTAELITLDFPGTGDYEIKVNGFSILTSKKQDFNIAYAWDSLSSFRFVTPLQQSDFYLGNSATKQIKINWISGAMNTSDTGSLAVTTNNGNTWQLISSGVPLKKQIYYWPYPDTNAIVQFRMTTNYGSYYTPEILLGKLTTLKTDYLCTDSFRLSWSKQILANRYQLFTLADSSFMRSIAEQTDTFIVLNRIAHPENIYSVLPILNNNIPATRSIAIDITKQSFSCMYRSFYGIPIGESIQLNLDLDFIAGLDSIELEKVNSLGTVKNSLENILIKPSQFSYTVFDYNPEAGANFYRAKIWINGSFILTEVINIIYPGSSWLFLYPNPARPGSALYYSARETPKDLYLQIYSMQGQLMASHNIQSSGSIPTEDFWEGIYFYLLTNSNNEKLQGGKIIFR